MSANRESYRGCLLPFPGIDCRALLAGITRPRTELGEQVDVSDQTRLMAYLAACDDPTPWIPVWVRQVHGSTVLPATGLASENGRAADGLITNRRGVLLVTRHADCLPVLLFDPTTPAIALLHSGRRGTLGDIAGAAVEALRSEYGCTPPNLIASVGPGVRQCCYSVSEEVLPSPSDALHVRDYVEHRGGHLYLDLFGLVAFQLRAAGVGAVYGAGSSPCTCCGPLQLPSYRRTGLKTTFAAVAGLLR